VIGGRRIKKGIAMVTVLCMRWLAGRPQAKAAPPDSLEDRWHRCAPPAISQEEWARLMGVSERADPPPQTACPSFGVAIR